MTKQARSLSRTRKEVEKSFEEYQRRFAAVLECGKAVRQAIEEYEEARAEVFLGQVRKEGLNPCALHKSKECEQIVPQDALEYVYLTRTEEAPRKKVREVLKGDKSSLRQTEQRTLPGVYAVCSECLREILLPKRILLEDEYFIASPVKKTEEGFLLENGEHLTNVKFFDRPLQSSTFLPDKGIREIGLPASAHFFDKLESIYSERDLKPELFFGSMSELFNRRE